MTRPTGRPPGRPKGSLNRLSRQARDQAAATGMLPHEFLLAVTRGEKIDGYTPTFENRLEAAKAAAPFYAPKLSAVEASVVSKPLEELTEDELDALIAVEAAKARSTSGGKLQ